MHLLVTVAIVTLNVAIISNGAANLTVDEASVNAAIPSSSSDLSVNGEKRKVSFSIPGEIVDAPTKENEETADATSDAKKRDIPGEIVDASTKKNEETADATSDGKKREALELVMDRARNFSARLLTRWRDFENSYVVSPLMQFLYIATNPYQRRLGEKRALMNALSFENDDPRTVELGLRILTDNLDNYMTVESSERHRTGFTCAPSIKIKDMIQASLSKFLRQQSNSDPLSNGRWDISFDAVQRSKYGSFKPNKPWDNNKAKYMRINDVRCRYGKFDGSTFVELTSDKNHSENGTSLFIIRTENKEGWVRLNDQLGAINFEELRANSSERIVDIYLPKFSLERELQSWMWTPSYFELAQPLWQHQYTPYAEYDKKYFVRVGRNKHAGGISPKSDEDQAINNETGTTEREEKIRFEVNRPFVIILAKTGAVNLNLLTIGIEGQRGVF